MSQKSRHFREAHCIWHQVMCYSMLILIAVNLNICHCDVNQDMRLTKFDIIPILSDICSPKNLMPQTSIKINRKVNPTAIDILRGSEIYPNHPFPSYLSLNETVAATFSGLTDEFIMCMDQLIEPNTNLGNDITGPNSVQNKLSDMPLSSENLDNEDINLIDSYVNQTNVMELQILLMLKDFNLLSEAVKTKADIHGDALDMEDNQTTQIGNRKDNTFLNSAITLYDTFISHYNMTDDYIHDKVRSNYSPQNYLQNNVENANGILFNQDSLFSSRERYLKINYVSIFFY